MSRFVAVCTLLCSAVVLASAANAGPAMLSDWLEKQTTAAVPSSTAKSAAAPAYEEADFEWGCLMATRRQNCRCIGCSDVCSNGGVCDDSGNLAPLCCQTRYSEFSLSCCDKKDHDSYGSEDTSSLLTNLDIGSCEFTSFELPIEPQAGPLPSGPVKVATFKATCNINGGEQCGHPFCDAMVLTWQGAAYGVEAVSKTNPTEFPKDGSCEDVGFLRSGLSFKNGRLHVTGPNKDAAKPAPPKATKPAPQKAKKADAAEPAYYHHEESSTPTTYFIGSAIVLTGPVTVSSRKYKIKYNTGSMDFVQEWFPIEGQDGPVTVTPAEAANLHLVAPYKFTLKLAKEARYY